MTPDGNIRRSHTALLAGSTSGPECQYRWPLQTQILQCAIPAEERQLELRPGGNRRDAKLFLR